MVQTLWCLKGAESVHNMHQGDGLCSEVCMVGGPLLSQSPPQVLKMTSRQLRQPITPFSAAAQLQGLAKSFRPMTIYFAPTSHVIIPAVPAGFSQTLWLHPHGSLGVQCPCQTITVPKLLSAHSDGVVDSTQLPVCLTVLTSISDIR